MYKYLVYGNTKVILEGDDFHVTSTHKNTYWTWFSSIPLFTD